MFRVQHFPYIFTPFLACHSTCAECVATSNLLDSRCTTCKDEAWFIENERCVETCDTGYYARSFENEDQENMLETDGNDITTQLTFPANSCAPCHANCAECKGSGKNRCTKCFNKNRLTSEVFMTYV